MLAPVSPAAVRHGDDRHRWFRDEIRAHEPALRAFLHSHFPSIRDVDDIVQEAYVRVLRACERGAKFTNGRSFLFTTARNLAVDQHRHQQVLPLESLGHREVLTLPEERPHAGEVASRAQELALLAEAIDRLPKRCQEILRLRRLHGRSHREIAEKLGISERTVNAQLAIGVERVRDYLRSRGVFPDRPDRAQLPK